MAEPNLNYSFVELSVFVCLSVFRRKHDVTNPHNLYTLLSERLLLNTDALTLATYNVLFEVVIFMSSSSM